MMIMPSEAFVTLTDDDVARIIAYMKTLPQQPGPAAAVTMGPLGRIGVATGRFKPVAQIIADIVPPPEASGEPAAFGRYLARTVCGGCHEPDLRGFLSGDHGSCKH